MVVVTLTRAEAAAPRGRTRKPPARRESAIQREILAYLATVPGVVAWRANVGAMRGEHKGKRWFVRFGAPGMSDLVGWRETPVVRLMGGLDLHMTMPRWLAIEVKRPGEHPTPAQLAFLERVRRAGGIALVAYSLDDVRQALA